MNLLLQNFINFFFIFLEQKIWATSLYQKTSTSCYLLESYDARQHVTLLLCPRKLPVLSCLLRCWKINWHNQKGKFIYCVALFENSKKSVKKLHQMNDSEFLQHSFSVCRDAYMHVMAIFVCLNWLQLQVLTHFLHQQHLCFHFYMNCWNHKSFAW